MKLYVVSRSAAVGALALSMVALASPAHAEKIANSYICVFKKDRVGKDEVAARASSSAKAHGGAVRFTYQNTIRGFSANISEAGMNAMRRANPNIAYCEQDQVATVIGAVVTAKGKPGGSTPPAQTTPWGITRVNGGVPSTGTAWVIDSGIDGTHSDLNVDAGRSADFTGSRSGWTDENGHGTHVAGTIAAKDNSIGVIGVAAGAKVVAVRVLDRRGSGAYSGVIKGVDYVGGAGASGDVANMSLGGPVSQALDDAVLAASSKVKFALAAGNESDDAENHSPARAAGVSKTDNVYAVSAMDSKDGFASFSNFGPDVSYAEPGVSIYSTYKGNSYATLSGTSMASPHLAGLMLLGTVSTDGTVNNDPDGNPDPIGVH